jgi:hypothetical protein
MAWRREEPDPFPAPLREFVESEWPPVEAECLQHYGCDFGTDYSTACAPRPGEFCGQLHYEALSRDYPDRPDMLDRAKCADAYTRFRQARLNWLGEDHPLYLVEWVARPGEEHAIRYGRAPGRQDYKL